MRPSVMVSNESNVSSMDSIAIALSLLLSVGPVHLIGKAPDKIHIVVGARTGSGPPIIAINTERLAFTHCRAVTSAYQSYKSELTPMPFFSVRLPISEWVGSL